MILASAASGTFAGVVLFVFSHVAPMFGAGNFIRDLDKPRIFGAAVSRREAHVVGALTHILVSGASGAMFGFLVSLNIFQGFDLISLLGWSVVMTLAIGGVILPLEGHGVFGVKEDAWFPVDLFITNILWSVLFWWMIRILLPLLS
ncbi:MAG: hypothetical protein AAB879_01930 [Patescibacteria group bacterium]